MYNFVINMIIVLCIIAWGWLINRKCTRLSADFDPLAGMAWCIAFLEISGALNLLYAGSIFILGGSLFILIYILYSKIKGHFPAAFSYGYTAFIGGAVMLSIIYLIKEPCFAHWDEFSHWGIYFKSVFYEHKFTIWINGQTFVHPSYSQGGMTVYSLFALLKKAYSEGDALFSVNLIVLAALSSIWGSMTQKQKTGKLFRCICILASVGTPLLLCWFDFPDATAYLGAYMDIPLGAIFLAGIAVLLETQDITFFQKSLAAGILCAAMVSIKDIGILYSLCIWGIWLVILFLQKDLRKKPVKILRPFLTAVLPAAAEVVLWKAVLKITENELDQFSNLTLSSILSVRSDPNFHDIVHAFIQKLTESGFLFGLSAAACALLCTAAGILFVIISFRQQKYEITVSNLLMPFFFLCYMLTLQITYLCGMTLSEALNVQSFERYAGSFFIAWTGLLLISADNILGGFHFSHSSGQIIKRYTVSAFLICNALFFIKAKGIMNCFTFDTPGWKITEPQVLQTLFSEADVPEGSSIWYMGAGNWDVVNYEMTRFRYEAWPQRIVFYNPFTAHEDDEDSASMEQLLTSVKENTDSVDYLLLSGIDDTFKTKYQSLFSDKLASAGGYALYKVTAADENPYFTFTSAAEKTS